MSYLNLIIEQNVQIIQNNSAFELYNSTIIQNNVAITYYYVAIHYNNEYNSNFF